MPGHDFEASWDAVAERFGALVPVSGGLLRGRVIFPYVLRWLARDPRGRAVIDIGCGTGSLSCKLAEESWSTTGIDFSAEMIRIARARASRHRWPTGTRPPEFVRADIRRLDLDRRFDLAVSLFTMQDCDDIDAYFEGVRGALESGGRLLSLVETRAALIEGTLPTSLPKRLLREDPDQHVIEVDWGEDVTRTHWRSESRIREACDRSGLAVVAVEALSDLGGSPKYMTYEITRPR